MNYKEADGKNKGTFGFLTYRDHHDKEDLREHLRDVFKNNGDMKLAVAHETADEECPYEHTHVVIHFGKSTTMTKKRLSRDLDFNGVHPHFKWMVKNGKKDPFWCGVKYILKEDEDVGYELPETFTETFEDTVEAIWHCKDEREVLKMCKESKDVLAYLAAYRFKYETMRHLDYADKIRNLELNDWQTIWWSKLKKQNDRKILWICDKEGGKGKTMFGKWLRVVHGGEKMILRSKAVNFMYKGGEYVYVNLTRTQEEFIGYGALEEIKDGDMFTDKYEGKSVLYAPPKVIVFANFYPNTSAMTEDRWSIMKCRGKAGEVALRG